MSELPTPLQPSPNLLPTHQAWSVRRAERKVCPSLVKVVEPVRVPNAALLRALASLPAGHGQPTKRTTSSDARRGASSSLEQTSGTAQHHCGPKVGHRLRSFIPSFEPSTSRPSQRRPTVCPCRAFLRWQMAQEAIAQQSHRILLADGEVAQLNELAGKKTTQIPALSFRVEGGRFMEQLRVRNELGFRAIQELREIADETLATVFPEKAEMIRALTEPVRFVFTSVEEARAFADKLRGQVPERSWVKRRLRVVTVQLRNTDGVTPNYTVNIGHTSDGEQEWVRVSVVVQLQHALAMLLENAHRVELSGVPVYSNGELQRFQSTAETLPLTLHDCWSSLGFSLSATQAHGHLMVSGEVPLLHRPGLRWCKPRPNPDPSSTVRAQPVTSQCKWHGQEEILAQAARAEWNKSVMESARSAIQKYKDKTGLA